MIAVLATKVAQKDTLIIHLHSTQTDTRNILLENP